MDTRPLVKQPGADKELRAFRGNREDLRAMKRALAHAPLGPKATMALTAAIVALESDLGLDDASLRRTRPS